jgi:hypothetical protein
VTASSPSLVAPAYSWCPESFTTLGDEVADLATQIGFGPDPEQRLGLDMMYAARADRVWQVFEFCVICSRQNLKTGLFKMGAVADLWLFDDRLVLWTAHRYDATEGAFRDIKELIDANYLLSKRVKSITQGTGDMEIILSSGPANNDGPTMQFLARSSGSARSKSANKLFYDEAFALRPSDIGDSVPTLATLRGAQIRYGSSAGKAASAVLRSIRDRGRRGGDPGLAYLEWGDTEAPSCVDGEKCTHAFGVDGCCLDDRSRWRRSNPAMGRRIMEERIESFRRMMPPEEFAREFLGWWDKPADVVGVFGDPMAWVTAIDRASVPVGALSFALEVSQDSAWACIAGAGFRADGLLHAELAKDGNRRGTAWVVPFLVDVTKKHGGAVAVSPLSPAAALIPDLEAAGVEVIKLSSAEYAQACGQMVTKVREGQFKHLGQPAVDVAVAGSFMKSTGDTKVIDRKHEGVDISPFLAVVLAGWAAVTRPTPTVSVPLVAWR